LKDWPHPSSPTSTHTHTVTHNSHTRTTHTLTHKHTTHTQTQTDTHNIRRHKAQLPLLQNEYFEHELKKRQPLFAHFFTRATLQIVYARFEIFARTNFRRLKYVWSFTILDWKSKESIKTYELDDCDPTEISERWSLSSPNSFKTLTRCFFLWIDQVLLFYKHNQTALRVNSLTRQGNDL
jgi:hypothetical protein